MISAINSVQTYKPNFCKNNNQQHRNYVSFGSDSNEVKNFNRMLAFGLGFAMGALTLSEMYLAGYLNDKGYLPNVFRPIFIGVVAFLITFEGLKTYEHFKKRTND